MCKGAGGLLFEHDFRVLMYSADLVLTQEALISERSLRTYSLPGFQAIHGASYRRLDGLRDGVMTLTRANAGSHMQRIVCKYPEPIFKTPKAALVSFFDWAGIDRPVMVVNIHATLVRSKRGAMDEIGHLVEHLPDHDGPIILAGDFNTFTRGYLEGVAQVLGGLGLHLIKIGDDPRSRTSALDQIFVRGLKVRWLTVDTTIKNSDHFPLIAELDPS
jgi:endonuclease/exonuclease/phosphatase (EEP) superfamily protein YafD